MKTIRFLLFAAAAGLATNARAELPTTPSWTGELNLANAGLGYDVAAAGDVNGDGYSDVLVTSLAYAGPGAAFIFLGSENGLSPDVNWMMQEGEAFQQYGISSSGAGDVNGDGYDDAIVGCWGCGSGGKAFVYHGGPSSLGFAMWTGEGLDVNEDYGEAVGAAGDVNGDGYDDVIVGAYNYDGGQNNEGRAYVYFGSFGGLSPTPNWTFEPDESSAHCGSSVYGAGDVNGDGFDDIVVGGSGHGPGGGAWVFHGSPTGPSITADWYGSTSQGLANYGYAVGPAGDVNGDGYADVVIGARTYDNGNEDEGAAFLYLGSATGLESTPVWSAEGGYDGALFGNAVRTAGDVNGDGYAEFLVGARALPSGAPGAGRAQLYYGGPEGPDALPRWLYGGGEMFAYLGTSISGAGDVNGDGLSDVIVGAPGKSHGESGEGLALAFYGQPDGPVTYPPRWTIDGGMVGAQNGRFVAHAGDVNGDGLGDILVSAPLYSGVAAQSGRVRLWLGTADGDPPTIAATIDGEQGSEFFGNGIDGAGDVNGDGYEDIIMGGPLYDGTLGDAGRALVYHGSSNGIGATPDWEVEGPIAGMGFGSNVAGAGDVNGDGFDDALVGAFLYTNGETSEGIAYLYYGSASGLETTPAWSYESNFENAFFGYVRSAGDLNGDGFSDFVVGSPRYSDSHGSEGGIFLFYGSQTGPAITPDRIFTPNQQGCGTVTGALAGDVNGDGFDDFLFTCPNFNGAGGVFCGRVWIHHGSSTGVSETADTIIDGQSTIEDFGTDADGAGDVNGDGYSDIIVGGAQYDGGFDNQGVARIYLGSASGLSTTDSWEFVTEQDESGLGNAVRGLGDINGDGFADVATAAEFYDGYTGEDEGRVFLHLGGDYYNPMGGTPLRPRQAQHTGTPLALGGTSIDGHRVQLIVDARSPMGRDDAAVEWQMAPDGTPIDGGTASLTPSLDTGAPGADGSVVPIAVDVSALTPETGYQWRMRLHYDSVFVPYSRWMSAAPNVPSMVSFKTGTDVVAVDSPVAGAVPRLAMRPNPMRAATTIRYVTYAPGAVRVSILDVSGREVVVLEDATKLAGPHAVVWDGALQARPAPAGVYFTRVETSSEVFTGKLVVLR